MNYEALIFDLDGTLWDATENIQKSWNIAIQDFEELKGHTISKKMLTSIMGLPMDEISSKLFPNLSKKMQAEVMERCCLVENEYLTEHGAILFPMVEDTLQKLSKRYPLFIVSNGQEGYIQTFLTSHKMEKYFTDVQNWGDNPAPKGENIKLIMKRNNIGNAVYIGDTDGDAKAAQMAGIDFIYARYGFGQVDTYTYAIDEFKQLNEFPAIVQQHPVLP